MLSDRAETILIVIGIAMMIITMIFTLELYLAIMNDTAYGFDFKECIKEFDYDVCDILFTSRLQSVNFNGSMIPDQVPFP